MGRKQGMIAAILLLAAACVPTGIDHYERSLAKALHENLVFPETKPRVMSERVYLLDMKINRLGQMISYKIITTDEVLPHDAFIAQIESALTKMGAFPPMPSGYFPEDAMKRYIVPVRFRPRAKPQNTASLANRQNSLKLYKDVTI